MLRTHNTYAPTKQRLIHILNRIRVGQHTKEDITQINLKYTRKPVHDLDIAHLYFTNEKKDKHNEKVFEKTIGETYILEAKDCRHATCNKKIQIPNNPKETAGLHQTLKLKISMLIEICSENLDVYDGLVNGAEAIFMGVTKIGLEEVIWLKFTDVKTGRETRKENFALYNCNIPPPTWTPIKEISKEFKNRP